MKRRKSSLSYPNDIDSAKNACRQLCNEHDLVIIFNNDQKIFNSNTSRLIGNRILCYNFADSNYDLLVFSVLHEIGHSIWYKNMIGRKEQKLEIFPFYTEMKNQFARELEAWEYAVESFNATFKRNISIKQANFMIDCLKSYVPDYNSYNNTKHDISQVEKNFWCPMKKKILK